ncbi:MAG: triose-phosphate isomerase [Candidatus Pacebacteria bacterium]|nr:triose-phosphate isomerase [Candidatus Paceibacterota bacterium]
MKKIIVGNFKMNPLSKKKAEELFKVFDIKTKHLIILCPPFTYLQKGNNYILGAQNCFYKNEGAYTGEISPKMLKDLGCKYVIIGHSERREIFKEDNECINLKIKICLENKLKPILCIGEKLGGDRKQVLRAQLKGINNKNIIIAYEPVWAIGTGKACGLEDILSSYNLIKKIAKENKVLYGGSVNSSNAKEIINITDGVLVGGASINKKEFLKIIK